jgi:hypothetical protein
VMKSRRLVRNMGVFSPVTTLGLPHAQPAARQPASPWVRPESF